MSATGRNLPGAERHADDFYATPPWCVEALLRGSNLPSGRWLEPTAGDGAIVEEILHHRIDVEWHLVESRAEELRVGGGLLSRLLKPDFPTDRVASVEIRDFLTMPAPAQPFDVVLGNPPFNLAAQAYAVYLRAAKAAKFHGRKDGCYRVRMVLLGRQAVPRRDSLATSARSGRQCRRLPALTS